MRHLVIAVAASLFAAWAVAPTARVTQLTWLAGCWEQTAGPRLVEEQWTRPRGGLMLGAGRTVRGDTLVEYEQTRIFERGGHLVYGANPSGQAPAEFESIELSDSSVTISSPWSP